MVLLVWGVLTDEKQVAVDTSVSETYFETAITSDCSLNLETETKETQPTIEVTSTINANAITANLEGEKYAIAYYTDSDAVDIAKVLYRECRGVLSVTEQACVAWTILNRVDRKNTSIRDVISSPNQFAFIEDTPVDDDLLDIAYDVLDRWSREKNGEIHVGRVLPNSYLYFEGHDGHNFFRDNYSGDYTVWDYSLESPYET